MCARNKYDSFLDSFASKREMDAILQDLSTIGFDSLSSIEVLECCQIYLFTFCDYCTDITATEEQMSDRWQKRAKRNGYGYYISVRHLGDWIVRGLEALGEVDLWSRVV